MPDTAVYLGPTLPRNVAESILDAIYLPPIRRGDLARLPENIRRIAIVDGEFYQSLAISTKEILPLLDRGIMVYGSSSMGALRAAETHKFGMVGVGEIFTMYRDGILDGDDEVAITYDPHTYRSLSDALVNLRRALDLAVSADVIDEPERDSLVAQLKMTYFPHRSYRQLEALCPKLRAFLRSGRLPDLKRDDALLLLATLADSIEVGNGPAARDGDEHSSPEWTVNADEAP